MSDNIHHKVLLEGDYRLSPTTLRTHTFFAGEYKHLKKWFSYYQEGGFFMAGRSNRTNITIGLCIRVVESGGLKWGKGLCRV